jgi:hypothetical protein
VIFMMTLLYGKPSDSGERKTDVKPEVRDLWVKALKSGEYKQGYGSLRTASDKFCAIGVLVDLAIKDGVEMDIREPTDSFPFYMYDGMSARLPDAVKQWAGNVRFVPIINMNDGKHNKFVTIAKWIKENI